MSRLWIALVVCVAACGETKNPAADAGADAGPALCTVNTACMLDSTPGLCTDGFCGTCAGTQDDARCAAAYGAGNICVQGACIPGDCHATADCGGGKTCIQNQCVGCASDNDCDDGQTCTGGACVAAAAACSGKAVGAACGTGELCCTRQNALTCVEVQCCTDAQCGANQTCQAGQCVAANSGCTAPPQPTYFVDPAYTGPSTGSQTCPFKTLHGAFNAVRTDEFLGDSDVVVKGGTIDATSEGGADKFPLTIPSSVFLRTQTGLPDATIVAPANTTAFQAPFVAQAAATQPWSARVSHLTIKQTAAGTAGTAVLVTGGTLAKPVHVDHVTITNFQDGIDVDGGKALMAFGVDVSRSADAGLRVAAGRATITVGANADAFTKFHDNKVGILVTGDPASVLDATGSQDATGLDRVSANSNTEAGIRLFSTNAANSLVTVGASLNGNSGLSVVAGVKIKVRGSRFKQNGQSGVRISANGSVTAVDGIDLGVANDFGQNELGGNTDSELCINLDTLSVVLAAGNIWNGLDCSKAAGGSVQRHVGCAGKSGIGTVNTSPIPAIVANCQLN
jgi:hypothetical protein